jgi:hypothetical protein
VREGAATGRPWIIEAAVVGADCDDRYAIDHGLRGMLRAVDRGTGAMDCGCDYEQLVLTTWITS